MSLQASHRSKSAPQPLTAVPSLQAPNAPIASSRVAAAVGPLHTPTSETQDAFNLDGFFPRSNSYFSLSSMNPSASSSSWVYGSSSSEAPREVDESVTPAFSPPMTPGNAPSTFPLAQDVDAVEIEAEDRIGHLAYSALSKMVGTPAGDVTYEHDHLFHSYDALHGELAAKRRSATAPDLAKLVGKKDVAGGMYVESGGAPISILFSPTEEDVDFWGTDGETKEVQEGESWVTYIFEGAKRLWVRKPISNEE